MKRIRVTSRADLEAFKRGFEARAGNHVSIQYLAASDVYAYRSNRQLVAGYVIHSECQHRFFDLMDQIGWEQIRALPGKQEDFCEITCMWMEPDVRSFPLRVRFYTSCTLQTFFKRRRFIIGGTKIDAVAQMQRYCLPNVLFEGATENAIGNGNWTIYYGTPWSFAKGFVRLFVRESLKLLSTDQVSSTAENQVEVIEQKKAA